MVYPALSGCSAFVFPRAITLGGDFSCTLARKTRNANKYPQWMDGTSTRGVRIAATILFFRRGDKIESRIVSSLSHIFSKPPPDSDMDLSSCTQPAMIGNRGGIIYHKCPFRVNKSRSTYREISTTIVASLMESSRFRKVTGAISPKTEKEVEKEVCVPHLKVNAPAATAPMTGHDVGSEDAPIYSPMSMRNRILKQK